MARKYTKRKEKHIINIASYWNKEALTRKAGPPNLSERKNQSLLTSCVLYDFNIYMRFQHSQIISTHLFTCRLNSACNLVFLLGSGDWKIVLAFSYASDSFNLSFFLFSVLDRKQKENGVIMIAAICFSATVTRSVHYSRASFKITKILAS